MTVILLLLSCRNDDDETLTPPCNDPTNEACPNYDPCFGKLPTTAEFTMANRMGFYPPWNTTFFEDSIFFGGLIKFEAVDSTADFYQWIFGIDTLEGGPELRTAYRTISSLPPGQYFAKLTVEKIADETCFPEDIGRDSVYKNFYYIYDVCEAAVINKFKGVFEDMPQDSVVIELLRAFNGHPECTDNAKLHCINFLGNGDTLNVGFDIVGSSNRIIYWDKIGSGTPLIKGFLHVASDDSVVAEYMILGTEKKFRGRVL